MTTSTGDGGSVAEDGPSKKWILEATPPSFAATITISGAELPKRFAVTELPEKALSNAKRPKLSPNEPPTVAAEFTNLAEDPTNGPLAAVP